MKKILVVTAFLAAFLHADCNIISSAAKDLGELRGTDAVALSLSKAYYDDDKKMQIRSYSDAYLDFYKQATDYIQEDCEKYGFKVIYNFKVNHLVDENYYHFNATWDF